MYIFLYYILFCSILILYSCEVHLTLPGNTSSMILDEKIWSDLNRYTFNYVNKDCLFFDCYNFFRRYVSSFLQPLYNVMKSSENNIIEHLIVKI